VVVLALSPSARLPADSECREADQAHAPAGRADKALRRREQKNKDQDELRMKASAGGQKVQPTQSPPSSPCQTTGTV
jgi:hypothetical protein